MLSHVKDDFRKLSLEERIQLVEDLWDSIAADHNLLPLTPEERAELDRRLDAYQANGNPGRLAEDVSGHKKETVTRTVRRNAWDRGLFGTIRQDQAFVDRYESRRGATQCIGRELRDAVNLDVERVAFAQSMH